LDDLQWIDQPSLELIESLLTDLETPALMIIASYRDEEVDRKHIFTKTLQELTNMKDLKLQITNMHVNHLGVDDICELLKDLIDLERKEGKELAQCIHGKTGGNAFT
jgi:predicted ATPase